MTFNNVYFPAKDEHAEVDGLLNVPEILNCYTLNSGFDSDYISNEIRLRYPNVKLNLTSGSNRLNIEGTGTLNDQKFMVMFEGEGIRFKILFEKNSDFKKGFVSLEFYNGADHLIKSAVEKCVLSCLISDTEKNIQAKSEKKTKKSESGSREKCSCSTAAVFAADGSGLSRADYTNQAYGLLHVRLSNGAGVDAFICQICNGAVLIATEYTDRPPYTSHAIKLTNTDVEKIKKIDSTRIEEARKKSNSVHAVMEGYLKTGEPDLTREIPEILKSETTGSFCNCASANTYSSGASPILISDFTPEYITHYRYSNHHEYGIFTCKICQTNWFIQSNYCDRPPYVCSAERIEFSKIQNILRYSSKVITEALDYEGIHSLGNILNGQTIDIKALRLKHVPKCQCSDYEDDPDCKTIRAITQLTDSRETRLNYEYKEWYLSVYECKLCKTGWVFYFRIKSNNSKGWGVKKVESQLFEKFLSLGNEPIKSLLEKEGTEGVLKSIETLS